jgi:GTP-binding protein
MFKSIKFIKSGTTERNSWPLRDVPEVCFVGRSNVGKSSLINAIFNQKKLAKVANKPGKTLLLNFFEIDNDKLILTDTPGYGFSKASKVVQNEISDMMLHYFECRKALVALAIIVDVRRKLTTLDLQLLEMIASIRPELDVMLLITKADKISYSQALKAVTEINAQIKKIKFQDYRKIKHLLVSAKNKQNLDKVQIWLTNYFRKENKK